MKKRPGKGALSCVITSGDLTPRNYPFKRGETLALISRCAMIGASMIQIREKALPGRLMFDLTRAAVATAKGTTTKILVNDRFDVALAAGANGVHLTSKPIPVAAIRRNTPEGFLIGASTHSLEELILVRDQGADYAVFGPVFETPGKVSDGGPKGLEELRDVCSLLSPFRVLALGGIDQSTFRSVVDAGAAGVAAIRLFRDPLAAKRVISALSVLDVRPKP